MPSHASRVSNTSFLTQANRTKPRVCVSERPTKKSSGAISHPTLYSLKSESRTAAQRAGQSAKLTDNFRRCLTLFRRELQISRCHQTCLRGGPSATRGRVARWPWVSAYHLSRHAGRDRRSLPLQRGCSLTQTSVFTGLVHVVLVSRQRHSRQDTNDRHDDHQFNKGKTLLDFLDMLT